MTIFKWFITAGESGRKEKTSGGFINTAGGQVRAAVFHLLN